MRTLLFLAIILMLTSCADSEQSRSPSTPTFTDPRNALYKDRVISYLDKYEALLTPIKYSGGKPMSESKIRHILMGVKSVSVEVIKLSPPYDYLHVDRRLKDAAIELDAYANARLKDLTIGVRVLSLDDYSYTSSLQGIRDVEVLLPWIPNWPYSDEP